jgi:hypothetical protein
MIAVSQPTSWVITNKHEFQKTRNRHSDCVQV